MSNFYEDANTAMDLFIYTPEEFERMNQRPFIKCAYEEGAVLYEAGSSAEGDCYELSRT